MVAIQIKQYKYEAWHRRNETKKDKNTQTHAHTQREENLKKVR